VKEAEVADPANAAVIVAANGLQGQNVTTSGIRDYVADSQQQSAVQGPAFSLLPEGPQTVRIPESAVSRVRAGRRVFVSVPSDQVKDVPGQISEILPNPAQTTSRVFYQAVVNITGHSPAVPLNGMTADVEFGS
jgi:hypothetical protein